ncbi:MAG: flagellar hook-associated protein FlgK [Proteobacteria bacterium]|nr:flagellar hook-associated protein FlgK [Pseudomonadota bacterium]
MSGIWNALNIGKNAIAAQQYGLSVTGHNIANVNNPEYSRQTIPHTTSTPINYAGYLLGTGVEADQVQSSVNQLLENRLTEQESGLSSYEEMEVYLNVLEGYFNENSDSSLSVQISEFWNAWHDLSDNPTGTSERVIVYEKGTKIADQFDSLDAELTRLDVELSREISSAISSIDALTKEIAQINIEIVSGETNNRTANDLRDKRNGLFKALSEIIDTHSFEQPNGTLTVLTANGYTLVSGASTYGIELVEGQLMWQGSYGGQIDITDKITAGQIGGWLEIRDELIPKYKAELNAYAEDFIWSVNQAHSQGVGLEYFSTAISGTNAVDSTDLFSTMDFGDRIDYTKDFKMWIQDNATATPEYYSVNMDMGISEAAVTSWMGSEPDGNQAIYKFTVETGGIVGEDLEITQTNGPGMGEVQVAGDVTTALDNALSNNQTIYVTGSQLFPVQTFEINDTTTNGVKRSAKEIADAFSALDGVTAYASMVSADVSGISAASLGAGTNEGDAIYFGFYAGNQVEQISFLVGTTDADTQSNFESALQEAVDKINEANANEDLVLSGTGASRTITSQSGENIGVENFIYQDNAIVNIGNFGGTAAGDFISFELADDNAGTNGISVSFIKGANAVEDSENLYAALTEGSTADALAAAGYVFRMDNAANTVVMSRSNGSAFSVDNIRDSNALTNVMADVDIEVAGMATLDGGGAPVTITEGGNEDVLAAPVLTAAKSIGFSGIALTEGGAADSAVKTGTVTVTVEKGMGIQSNVAGAAGGLFDVLGGDFAIQGSAMITLGGDGGFTDFTNGNIIGFRIDGTVVTYPVNVVFNTDLERAVELEAQIVASGLGPEYSVSRNGADVTIIKTGGTPVEITNFIENNDGDATLAVRTGTGEGLVNPVNTVLNAGDNTRRSTVSRFYNSGGIISWEKFDADGKATGDKGLIDLSDAGPYVVEENNSGQLSIEISEGVLVAGNTFTVNTNESGVASPLDLSVSGRANSILDTYIFTVKNTGEIGSDTIEINWKNSVTSGSFEVLGQTPSFTPVYVEVDGMRLKFDGGFLFEDDVYTLKTDDTGNATVETLSDWHWTLDTFKDQFNKQSLGIVAQRTPENTLMFKPDDSAYALGDAVYSNSNGFDEWNTTITVTDYRAINHDVVTYIELERANGKWRFNDGLAPTVDIIPPGGTDDGFGIDLNQDGVADLRVDFETPVTGDGTLRFNIEKQNPINYSFAFSDSSAEDAGVMAALGINTFFTGSDAMTMAVNSILQEGQYIAAGQLSDTGDLSEGDNTNALNISNLQYESRSMALWSYNRGSDAKSTMVYTTHEDYYYVLVGDIGIESQSAQRNRSFSEIMVNKMSEQRDSVSAVSLDEEMINLMKYQHAFTVAAKLISISDEMLNTLVSMR